MPHRMRLDLLNGRSEVMNHAVFDHLNLLRFSDLTACVCVRDKNTYIHTLNQ
jgi:hypothetical protein